MTPTLWPGSEEDFSKKVRTAVCALARAVGRVDFQTQNVTIRLPESMRKEDLALVASAFGIAIGNNSNLRKLKFKPSGMFDDVEQFSLLKRVSLDTSRGILSRRLDSFHIPSAQSVVGHQVLTDAMTRDADP